MRIAGEQNGAFQKARLGKNEGIVNLILINQLFLAKLPGVDFHDTMAHRHKVDGSEQRLIPN